MVEGDECGLVLAWYWLGLGFGMGFGMVDSCGLVVYEPHPINPPPTFFLMEQRHRHEIGNGSGFGKGLVVGVGRWYGFKPCVDGIGFR